MEKENRKIKKWSHISVNQDTFRRFIEFKLKYENENNVRENYDFIMNKLLDVVENQLQKI